MVNFRPISLLSVLNRIIEKLFAEQLYTALEEKQLLSPMQYGFRRGRNCEQAAHHLVHYVAESVDNRSLVAAVFFDVSKAFDSVSHQRLLLKLERIGIGGSALSVLASYLSGRQQIFRHGDRYSSPRPITMGVPQGSNLGSLLFSVFINDLQNQEMDATVLSFADDTTLMVTAPDVTSLTEKASTCSTQLYKWMHMNGLVLNSSKTECLLFGTRREQLSFAIHHPSCSALLSCSCETVTNVSEHKFLGLHLDDRLIFTNHVDRVCKKLRAGVATLARIRATCTRELKRSVFNALISPHVGYMLAVVHRGL